ncbi:S1C family serine protease [Halobaculum sp. MBLA0143]|uniref:S1C family serine protease n=1 Tax=Halobaculum sp. MBLA0143 TaxID=3079933 RepID=UPI003525F54E
MDGDYERLYRETAPSVVSVYREAGRRGAGSGFVYDADHVLTNEHVVRGSDSVDVRYANAAWTTGVVVGSDSYTDLAVVQVPDRPADADPLTVADGDAAPTPGRPVAALGNPLGLDGSITTGVVSGVNRSMPTSGGFAVPDVVQTDAPIDRGNSGGPLVSAADDGYPVVGVNRAKSGDSVGFAVSARVIAAVVPALIAEGRYRHASLGVETVDVTPRVATANGLDTPRGVVVVGNRDGTTPLRGSRGTRRVRGTRVPVGGDVVVGFAGHDVRSHEELTRLLLTDATPGESVGLTVVRNGHERDLTVTPTERPVTRRDRERAAGDATTIPVE